MCYFQIYETNKQLDSPRWKDGWIQPIKSPVLEEGIPSGWLQDPWLISFMLGIEIV
jgi:hypothetical protein